jgi:hypothetical protein
MAHTITFDKLAYVKRLEKSGVQQDQAEAMAEALQEALEESARELATKKDILVGLKSELIKWIFGTISASTTLIISIMALLKFMR